MSGSLRTFFCPVCASAVRVFGPGAREAATCAVCGWGGSAAGISSAAELLSREADPWPDVSRRVAELVKQAERKADGGKRMKKRGGVKGRRTVEECIDEEEGKEAGMRGLKPRAGGGDGQVEEADKRGVGAVAVGEILPLSATVVDARVWRREQLPPRRRLRPTPPSLLSPHDTKLPTRPAAEFLPAIERARVVYAGEAVDDDGRMRVELSVRNVAPVSARVFLEAVDGAAQTPVEKDVPPGEAVVMDVEAAAFWAPVTEASMSPGRARLRMRVRFEEKAGGDAFLGKEWECVVFVSHGRAVVK